MRQILLRTTTLATAVALLVPAAADAATKVHLRGTAYEFNNTKVLIDDATIRVAEDPRLSTTTKSDGTYDLEVPAGKPVTPYITAPGYHSVHLQTFDTDESLERVNFQTPTEDIYRALAALLEVPLDENGNPRECAIVSTFSTRNVRDLAFRDFTGYGAHGIAGATAFATPALPSPIYFNENVIPDRTKTESSKDGGVIWTEVPRGTYTVKARHPRTKFASFVASCEPGRIVNANPTWGLYELGRENPAQFSARWSDSGVRPTRLRVSKLPAKAKVELTCSGSGCPFQSKTVEKPGKRRDLILTLGKSTVRLHAGQTITALVTAHAYDGAQVSWKLRDGRPPKETRRCVPLGRTKPRSSC